MADYDVIVIGAGPGGYVCAIRCAQLGLKTACVEGRETLGGTCLNIGCIPSKALLHASELYHEAHDDLRQDGPRWAARPTTIDVPKMQAYKQSTVDGQHQGHRVPVQEEQDRLAQGLGQDHRARGEVTVGDTAHKTKNIVIASGSEVTPLPGVTIDEKTIVSSTGALDLAEIPKRLAVDRRRRHRPRARLGLRPARLGGHGPRVPRPDHPRAWTSRSARRCSSILTKQGLKFVLGAAVQSAEPGEGGVRVTYKLRKDDSEAIARRRRRARRHRPPALHRRASAPTTSASRLTERGQIKVDAQLADQRPRRLRHRRRDRRPDARPQGRGRGHGRGRDHRRPARPRELRHDPERHLHLARGRRRRRDRGAAQGSRAAPTRSASSPSSATPAPSRTSRATAS